MSSYTLFVLRYSNFVKWVFVVCSDNKKRQFVMSKYKLLFLTKKQNTIAYKLPLSGLKWYRPKMVFDSILNADLLSIWVRYIGRNIMISTPSVVH